MLAPASTFQLTAERLLPALLPPLLLFSRALADITVVLTGLLFLIFCYQHRQWCWRKSPWFRLALLFWAYLLLVNLPFSVSPSDSFKDAVFFIRWPLFAAALSVWLLVTEQRRRQLIISLLAISIFVVIDTFWQYRFGVDLMGIAAFDETRLTGPFRNPVPGTIMLRVWFILLFAGFLLQYLQQNSRIQFLWFSGSLLLGLIFMFITGERMALLLYGLAGSLIFLAMYLHYNSYRRYLAILFLLAMGLMGLLMVGLPETAQRSIFSIFDKLSHFAGSDYGQIFAAAWQLFQQAPWFGNGIDSFQTLCQQQDLLAASQMPCSHPHNLYLKLAAETGIFGLLIYLLMLAGIYFQALKPLLENHHWLPVALSLAVLTVSFWPISGGISLWSNWIGALVWLGVGWVLAVAAVPWPTRLRRSALADH